MSRIKEEILSRNLELKFKVLESDFTRKRKQTFSTTVLFMMNFIKKSLSLEIENFVSFIKTSIGVKFEVFTKSAFVQCRKKIQPEVFKYLSIRLTEEFYTDNDDSIKLWNGFRLLAVDGSILTLPNTKELEEVYGKSKNQTKSSVVQARVSVLYDILNKFVLDGSISPLQTGEHVLALEHLGFSKHNDLIIYDRGYPSFNLIFEHNQRNLDFLIRAKVSFSDMTRIFYESGAKSKIVKMYPGKNTKLSNKPYNKNTFREIRLVRVDLPSGATEILLTSLLDNTKYPNNIFKQLYFQRWNIETFYDELKNKIKTEYFSGYSQQSILQDFYAALFVSNIQSLIVGEINEEIATKAGETKYQYKVNNNLSYGFLKDRIITLFFSETALDKIILELKDLFRKHLIPIRPNRKFNRNTAKYRKRHKPKVLKNMKDAF